MKSQAKLARSNMTLHGFFQLRRDIYGVWSVFYFLNLSQLPRTTAAKIDHFTKKTRFSFFFVFFHPFESFHDADKLFKNVKMRFAGSRVAKFEKIHDSESGPQTNLLSRTLLVFNQMGGKKEPLIQTFYPTKK